MPGTHPVRPPRSRIIIAGCTRAWALDRVARGYAPKGSIWFAGAPGRRAHLGDLYEPDPDWNPPDRPAEASRHM